MTKQLKVIVEKHPDGFVAYPLGLKGIVVGEGDTNDEALADMKSAIRFHIETFAQNLIEELKHYPYKRESSHIMLSITIK
jgi:predicted RNase H-like HicB family nuclease